MNGQDPFREKAISLFTARGINSMAEVLGVDADVVGRLIELQAKIYALDAYLEDTWKVEAAQLEQYWAAIYDALAAALPNLDIDKHDVLLDVLKYQSQELGTRQGGSPIDIPLTVFYHYKTCDIRLMRTLLCMYAAKPISSIDLTGWYAYDIITEVEDDMDDLQEDTDTFNVNRIMHALKREDNDKLIEHYITFIEAVYKMAAKQMPDHKVQNRIRQAKERTIEKLQDAQLFSLTAEDHERG